MKLVTFGDDSRVGVLDGEEISVLDVASMREYFERGGADEAADSGNGQRRLEDAGQDRHHSR